jgi:hypothetical protein
MANATDYLKFSTSQIVGNYKLRTRSVQSQQVTVTNTASDYELTVTAEGLFAGASVSPTQMILGPNENKTLTISFDTNYLETLPAGTIASSINFTAIAKPIFVPTEVPTPPPMPPILTDTPHDVITVSVTPDAALFTTLNQTVQYTATLLVNGERVAAEFDWSLTNPNVGVVIGNSGGVTANANGSYSSTVVARVKLPAAYAGQVGSATATAMIGSVQTGTLQVNLVSDVLASNIIVTGNGISRALYTQYTGGQTTTLSLPEGTYTITAAPVQFAGIYYNPSDNSTSQEVTIVGNTTTYATVEYTRQPADAINYIISYDTLPTMVNVGDTVSIQARTQIAGLDPNDSVEVGPISFIATNTREISRNGAAVGPGIYGVTFTAAQAGTMVITAVNTSAAPATASVIVSAIQAQDVYSIVVNAPSALNTGDTGIVTGTVYLNGSSTNIPVTFDASGSGYIITSTTGSSASGGGMGGGGNGDTGGGGGNGSDQFTL